VVAKHVLDRDRQASKTANRFSSRSPLIDSSRLRECLIAIDAQKCANSTVERLDAFEVCFGQFDGCNFARFKTAHVLSGCFLAQRHDASCRTDNHVRPVLADHIRFTKKAAVQEPS
jgi:hypothetical protein